MADYMVRAIAGGGNIRAFVASTTEAVEEARRRHRTWPTATAALGRTLTAAGLFSATLKGPNESITIRIAGDGPIGGIVCDANDLGQMRGFVRNPEVDIEPKAGKLDVAGVVGTGHVHVTRQLALEGVYTGTSELISGEIADDLTYYLTTSEQTPSAVALGVRVGVDGRVVAAGGYMVQLLPATSEEEREQLEVNLAAFGSVSKAVEDGLAPEQILAALMASLDYRVLERRDLSFACRCTRERAINAILMVETDELEKMLTEDGGAEMTCQFCGEVYRFSAETIRAAGARRE